jgi:hypothetical protein
MFKEITSGSIMDWLPIRPGETGMKIVSKQASLSGKRWLCLIKRRPAMPAAMKPFTK